ncbi:TetR/AcrR family transcriptional regulator [Mycolicibacterium diernhoferi]|uniref:TetR family transcriptional regulator n=1 Tax=Mycolicibacterium diernhoferi TaxID=1801 RepID=A0A1Q4HEU9_9MYCO|nr:TetR/AcrR family transcriptional regulator [Mycolicibacterium diernhoferi]OJZ66056.1 TetR family transcriptional regulator [Mycolicibacterium diernhoferi]OPE53049.1 TetR family transcriptional regulator [Mycolicibacterium diernhoferi]PEG54582.1 TetR/AcrR family transcriptional regulator [Mycolicibacterium diernhoferi]QYL23965.1 TetR/AcrR family transcriptional regulator; helix-turn-helix transcriptional regulator [Mycolicibacterium diernhoferi]
MATLVEAAAQVFSREGMAATTNRIAERAGLSIGTLYQYFPDKGALLHAVAARHVLHSDARLTALFERLRATAPPFEDTMDQVLRELVDLHADHPRLHALLHRVAMTAADLEEMRIFEDRICAEVAYHLKRCDRGTEEDPELTARSIVALVDAQLHRVMPDHGYDIEQLRLTVAHLAPARPAAPADPPPPAG